MHGRPVARAAVLTIAPPADLEAVVARALAEDVGAGDLTAGLVPAAATARARIVAREAAVLAGRPYAEEVFRQVEPRIALCWRAEDGDRLEAGAVFCELEGPARGLLTGERTALNFLQTLSATATATARYVEAVSGTGCTVLDTRKTLPGLRLAQKYAVRCGGGQNHRLGLYDGILIKENHIAAAGSIAAAVAAARAAGAGVTVEVEVESLAELAEALEAGPDVVMLDDFTLADMATAVGVNRAHRRPVKLEASGGVDLDGIRRIAQTGVDYVSVGGLTKHVRAVDLSMRIEGTVPVSAPGTVPIFWSCHARGRDPAGPPVARSGRTYELALGGHWPPRPRARDVTPDSALPESAQAARAVAEVARGPRSRA